MKVKKAAGLVILYKNKMLLGHPTNAKWYNSYSIPKGGLDKGETPIQAAIRETREEVGIVVPPSLINKIEHSFSLQTKKKKNKKIVYYFIVKIDDLSEIGLTQLKIPKNQLQLDEIDWAGFISYKDAVRRVTPSQRVLIDNYLDKINESKLLKFKEFSNNL